MKTLWEKEKLLIMSNFLFPQCFLKACFPGASKGVDVWEWVNPYSARWLKLNFQLYNQSPDIDFSKFFFRLAWLVVLGFNPTLTVRSYHGGQWRTYISWLSLTRTNTLFFPKPPTAFLTNFCRVERRKYTGKKVRLNRESNSQPPGHESDMLTTELTRQGFCLRDRPRQQYVCISSNMYASRYRIVQIHDQTARSVQFDHVQGLIYSAIAH